MQLQLKYPHGKTPTKVGSFPFFRDDTEKKYKENLENNASDMDRFGWSPLSFDENVDVDTSYEHYLYNPAKPGLNDYVKLSYDINSYGFRGRPIPESKTPRSIITLGDSTTFGTGMPEGIIWPTFVGHTLKYSAINLAQQHASLDTAFRLLMAWLPVTRSEYVFCLEPSRVSYELITTSFGYRYENPENWRSHLPFENPLNYQMQKEKNIRAMRSLCEQFGSKFVFLTNREWQDDYNHMFASQGGELDLARDLVHPGRKAHALITYKMLRSIGYEWDIENQRQAT